MPQKMRVHELARELGVESKELLTVLKDMGEYVRSASSTLEAPVVRRVREAVPAQTSAPSTPAKPVVPPSPPSPPLPTASTAPAPTSTTPASSADAPTNPTSTPRPGPQSFPRPGSRPGPRPGNNPFSAPRDRDTERPERPERPTRPTPPGRPTAPRPGAASSPRPGQPRPGQSPRPFPPGQSPRPGQRPEGQGTRPSARPLSRPNAPGSSAPSQANAPQRQAAPSGPPPRRGAPRSRTAPGAFGPGKKKSRSRSRFQEQDDFTAPLRSSSSFVKGTGQTLRISQGASIADVAERVGATPAALISLLFTLGEMVTATQSLSDATLEILGEAMGYRFEVITPEQADEEILSRLSVTTSSTAPALPRPPVVSVMGHVDHGKTRLLDALRGSDVLASEAGGITQRIGAYQVQTELGRPVTFLDTPGHEAFTAMRARGAKVTDIAVLVVAADDGVRPQTLEALSHARAAEIPVVVAITKVDKPGINLDRVRSELTEAGLVPEEYGGDTIVVEVSAATGEGLADLVESVLLTADAALDLTAPVEGPASGVVIDARLDKGRGPVASVLVHQGTLRTGDILVAGEAPGKVRLLLDEHLQPLSEALPSQPVQVLGLTSVPRAGDSFHVVPSERVARQVAAEREAHRRAAQLTARPRLSLEEAMNQIQESDRRELALVVKADVAGAAEALVQSLEGLDVPAELRLNVIYSGVGAITQSDVSLAAASQAVIIGFAVRPDQSVAELAQREGVDIRYYSVIYAALDDIQSTLKGMLAPQFEEVELGRAEVRAIFRSSRFGRIAGSLVRSGTIRRNASARLVRDGVVKGENLRIESLRREQEDATTVSEGYECGINLGAFNDVEEGDVIEVYERREIPR